MVPPSYPEEAGYLLTIFNELSRARTDGFSGPNRISCLEIKAYCELMDCNLAAWEIRLLQSMDEAYLEGNHELNKDGE